MPTSKIELVLYDFFQKLKKEVSMELDMKQYQLLLAYIVANPVRHYSDLLFVCQTLWLTKEIYRNDFNKYFDEAILRLPIYTEVITSEIKNAQNRDSSSIDNSTSLVSPIVDTDPAKIEPIDNRNTSKKVPAGSKENDQKEININIKNIGGVGLSSPAIKETKVDNFVLNEVKYLPFDKRIMEQGWRKLRGKSKYLTTDKLNFKAIFKINNDKGGIDQLIYEKESIGMQKVVWFSDHGGSMAPFSYWDDELFAIMKKVPNSDNVERYYFHDYPSKNINENLVDYLFFANRSHTQANFLSHILRKADKNTVFIFFSDGGAARKQDDMTRVEVFFNMVSYIKTKTRNVYFVNPVKNLGMSAAKYISYFVKTEFPSNKGIQKILQTN